MDSSYLAEFLLDRGDEVYGVGRRASIFNTTRLGHLIEKHAATLHDSDQSDSASLIRIIGLVRLDGIYNLDPSFMVRFFDVPEYFGDVDVIGVLRILGLEKKIGIYQASTSELYGKVEEIPQKETSPFHLYSPYTIAKQYDFGLSKNTGSL